MSSARNTSKAIFLPELEQPTAERPRSNVLEWLEVTGLGEGGNNLARMGVIKYVALILVSILTTMLVVGIFTHT